MFLWAVNLPADSLQFFVISFAYTFPHRFTDCFISNFFFNFCFHHRRIFRNNSSLSLIIIANIEGYVSENSIFFFLICWSDNERQACANIRCFNLMLKQSFHALGIVMQSLIDVWLHTPQTLLLVRIIIWSWRSELKHWFNFLLMPSDHGSRRRIPILHTRILVISHIQQGIQRVDCREWVPLCWINSISTFVVRVVGAYCPHRP